MACLFDIYGRPVLFRIEWRKGRMGNNREGGGREGKEERRERAVVGYQIIIMMIMTRINLKLFFKTHYLFLAGTL